MREKPNYATWRDRDADLPGGESLDHAPT